MSERSPCAKCGHEKLLIVSPFQIRNYEYANSQKTMPVALSSGGEEHDGGAFELRVCASCGFSEWWARDLAAVRGMVRVVDVGVAYR